MRKHDPLRINLDDVGDAMDRSMEDPAEPLLDLQTGEVVWVPRDETAGFDDPELGQAIEADPDRFLSIPRLESRDEYRWMEAFVGELDDDEPKRRLDDALAGRGAFGRFRAVLQDYRNLRERWFASRADRLANEARELLGGTDVEFESERRVVERQPLEPTPKKEKLALRVAHVLLLGDGDRTIVDGRVRRSINAGARHPRELFKLLARDLCVTAGVGWRNHFIDGKSSFELEGVRISVDRSAIHVDVDVPTAVATLFDGSAE